MTALAARRAVKEFTASTIELPGTAETIYEGGRCSWDTTTGKVCKDKTATEGTLIPIGRFYGNQPAGTDAAGTTIASGGTVLVKLDRELRAMWMVNSGTVPVVAADRGNYCYIEDDQTVRGDDGYTTHAVAGRVWAVDSTKGVLVEFLAPRPVAP